MTSRPQQLAFEEFFLPVGGPIGPALTEEDDLPPGPYRLGMTYDFETEQYSRPFCIVAGDGRTIAGHIPSLAIARKLSALLNEEEGEPATGAANDVASPEAAR